jgi:hypothetical protein
MFVCVECLSPVFIENAVGCSTCNKDNHGYDPGCQNGIVDTRDVLLYCIWVCSVQFTDLLNCGCACIVNKWRVKLLRGCVTIRQYHHD